MPKKRRSKSQILHDAKVKTIAEAYKRKGWDVHTRLKAYPSPKPIQGRIPDIVVHKGKKTVIIEIETSETKKTRKSRRDAFREYADATPHTTFKTRIATEQESKSDGKVTPALFRNKGKLYEMAARKAVSNVYARYPKDPDIDVVLALARQRLASMQNKPVKKNEPGRKRHSLLGTVRMARGKS